MLDGRFGYKYSNRNSLYKIHCCSAFIAVSIPNVHSITNIYFLYLKKNYLQYKEIAHSTLSASLALLCEYQYTNKYQFHFFKNIFLQYKEIKSPAQTTSKMLSFLPAAQ